MSQVCSVKPSDGPPMGCTPQPMACRPPLYHGYRLAFLYQTQVAFVDPCFSRAPFQLSFAVLTPVESAWPTPSSCFLCWHTVIGGEPVLDVVAQLALFLFVVHAFMSIEADVWDVRNTDRFGLVCWMLVGGGIPTARIPSVRCGQHDELETRCVSRALAFQDLVGTMVAACDTTVTMSAGPGTCSRTTYHGRQHPFLAYSRRFVIP